MSKNAVMDLRRDLAEVRGKMETLNGLTVTEKRDFTDEEQAQWDGLKAESVRLNGAIERMGEIQTLPVDVAVAGNADQRFAMPAFHMGNPVDNEQRAMLRFIRTGDHAIMRELEQEQRAANDTIMNATTGADGEYAVPDGHHQGIIAKAGESWLAPKLGLMPLPAGPGKTAYVPFDNESDVEFYSGSEQVDDYSNTFTRTSPAIGQATLAMARRDLEIPLTLELLEWEDSALLPFLNNWIGRAYAKDNNALMVTAAGSGGTAYNFAATGAIAASEVNGIVYSLPEGYENTAWLMKKATYGSIAGLQGDGFIFQNTPAGLSDTGRPELVSSPVYFSANAAAIGTSAKSVFFGDWSLMGYRNSGLRFQRNPYRKTGVVFLEYHYWAVYTVLISEAIRVGTQAAS